MLRARVRPPTFAATLASNRRLATPPESDLILGSGDLPAFPVMGAISHEVATLGSQLIYAPAADVVASGEAFVFAVPVDLPDTATGELFDWEFVATSTLAFFHSPYPLLDTTTLVSADAFHSTNPLTGDNGFQDGSKGLQFPAPKGYLVARASSALQRTLLPILDANLEARRQVLSQAAAATHAIPAAAGTLPGTPPAGPFTTPPTSVTTSPPANPQALAGFIVKDREGRQYSCLNKTESLVRVIELSAASRFMHQERFRKLFEHVEIDMPKIEARLARYIELAKSSAIPRGHELKSLARADDLDTLPLRQTKNAATFRQFLIADLRGMDQSVVGWWAFTPYAFKAWGHECTDEGREQLRFCVRGMASAMCVFYDAIFADVFAPVVEQLDSPDNPFRHYTDAFIAVQLWLVVCRPFRDAMEETHSQIPVSAGFPRPIATPADNYALLRLVLKESMDHLEAKTGVWGERKPHEDFNDKQHGLYRRVLWPTKAAGAPTPKNPSGSPLDKKNKKRKAAEAANPKVKVRKPKEGLLGRSTTEPCLLHLADNLKVKLGAKVVRCNWKPRVPAVPGDMCPNGVHFDVASMTRKQCADAAQASKWRHAPAILAGIQAAPAALFHP